MISIALKVLNVHKLRILLGGISIYPKIKKRLK